MFDAAYWPGWLHSLRLIFTFLLTVALGVHAYYQHKQESIQAVSPRKWMYWIYSMAFLAASAANFTQFCVTVVFRSYEKASFHLGYFTLLLMLSYAALLTGVKRRTYE